MKNQLDHLLLGSLLLGHLILLTSQDDSRGSPVERAALSVWGPIAHSARAVADGVAGFGDNLRRAGSLREENHRLQGEVEAMRRRLVELHGVEEELDRLARISDYQGFDTDSLFVADVVYVDQTSSLSTLVIHTGADRAHRNQPVVTDRGLVGRVLVAARAYAKVLLLTDRSAAAGAMIQRTRRRGIAYGGGENTLILDDIPLLENVEIGDEVVTAGIDGIFPRGIPIGHVRTLRPSDGLFYRIEVEPAIDFGVLDQVYVLTAEVIPDEIWEELYGRR